MIFAETYYLLFLLRPKLNYSTNFLALIDTYDQLILLDLLFFILLYAEVVAYVFICVYFWENFLEIVSYEYNLIFTFPDLFYGLYLAFSLTEMTSYSDLKR
jgi:hypothetical protein